MIFKKTVKEAGITAKLIKHINSIPGCFARKRFGGAFSSGDPDIQICYKGHTIFIEMKVMEGQLSDLQAIMMQRWQDAGATCVLGVWDHEQKAFAFFTNKPDWRKWCGKVKKYIAEHVSDGEYFNARYPMMQEVIERWYEDTLTHI